MYSWDDVARRTTRVYDALTVRHRLSLAAHFGRLSGLGPIAGPIAICFVAMQYLLLLLLRLWRPADAIEAAPDFPTEEWAAAGRRAKYEPAPAPT